MNPRCRGATSRATPNGRAMARFFGNSSPKTICNADTTTRARPTETDVATPVASHPSNGNCSSPAKAGSAR